jgi:hypothetical protein
MIRAIASAAVVVVCLLGRAAAAPTPDDPDALAERALTEAGQRAAVDPAGAIERYEAIGAALPVTRWSDHAWIRAARLAEQAGDFARARRALERALALGGDPRLAERARADLARLSSVTGGGRWDEVAAAHDRLAGAIRSGGDPKPALAALARLVSANPGYPRATSAVLVIAEGWERDGDAERALRWLTAQRGSDDAGAPIAIALIRLQVRHGDLTDATDGLISYRAQRDADPVVVAELASAIAAAERRGWLRRGLVGLVIGLLAAALGLLWRDARGGRGALRRLARPPTELIFLLPIGIVLAGVAETGNPMVARAVRQIMGAGLAIAWLSGALFDARRAAAGAVSARRAIAQAAAAVIAVAAVTYLALDHDDMLGVVAETWRGGPAMR